MEDIEKVVNELRKELEYHNYRYYTLADPIITDYEYDVMMKKLIDLEKKYPSLKSNNSPTQRIGNKVLDTTNKVRHTTLVYSLSNVYSTDELKDFITKTNENNLLSYVCELKIDGLSIKLKYEKGELVLAATRGDGETGEDVTDAVRTIKTIPLVLSKPIDVEVRGEVYMSKTSFEKLNDVRQKQGLPLFANPRNAAAGTLRQLDISEVAKRNLDSFIYTLENPELHNIQTQKDALMFLKELGFKVNKEYTNTSNINEIIDYLNKSSVLRFKIDYPTDGVVIKVNDFKMQQELGFTSKFPRWAIAYKFPAEQVKTKLRDITIQVGRMGTLTPVAELEPIQLAGSIIKRASLHNFDYIKERDIKIGDIVIVEKAGEVIPQIIKPIKEYRTGNERYIEIPDRCPVCGGKVGKVNTEDVAYKCLNPFCGAKIESNIENFVSKKAMNINGFGDKLVEKLLNLKIIKDPADIYTLKKEDISNLENMGEKSAIKILESIEKSKNTSFYRFITALGIPMVGETVAKLLAKKYHSIDEFEKATWIDMVGIEGIGNKIAESVVEYLSMDETKELLNKFKKVLVINVENIVIDNNSKIKDKKFVITGTLSKSRDEIKQSLLKLGAIISDSVSSKTDYVVVGDNPGSKLDKAKALGIKIINENELENLIKI